MASHAGLLESTSGWVLAAVLVVYFYSRTGFLLLRRKVWVSLEFSRGWTKSVSSLSQ